MKHVAVEGRNGAIIDKELLANRLRTRKVAKAEKKKKDLPTR